MNRQQLFVASVALVISMLGFFIAENRLADWSLFTTGVALLVANTASALIAHRGSLKPFKFNTSMSKVRHLESVESN